MGIQQILFIIVLAAAVWLFTRNTGRIRKNILLGRDIDRSDRSARRWGTMIRVALGQSKMRTRPVAALMHLIVYVGFIVINIEVIEILIDGIFGTHRVLSPLGGIYDFLISSFELLAFLVIIACVVFLIRRNILRLGRFHKEEMKGWPTKDANIILITEILLMTAFLSMNAADGLLFQAGADHYSWSGSYPVSQHLQPIFSGMGESGWLAIERFTWWFHIVGILAFLNYLVISKHFHIILAFPNTYYSKLEAHGEMNNMESVTEQVKLMMDPNADPYAMPVDDSPPERFGARDVMDLNWVQLMNAYTCTECGRCTSECPANITGKKLSPRKIVMDVRDRLEVVGENVRKNGSFQDDGKSLLDNHISREELWACTTCNACAEACPVNIDPVSIILDMRRYLVMEESAAPTELNMMMTNMENNGAPWQFAQADRLNWKDEN
jgi:heterodisulfide reductase subunit C